MRVAVLTVDQRGSTRRRHRPGPRDPGRAGRRRDAAPLRAHRGRRVPGRARRPRRAGRVVERLLREDGWNIGIGIGEVEQPLPESTRAGRGPAFVHARDAVTAAKSAPWQLRVAATTPTPGALETTLWLWAAVLDRRTSRGWEVADLVDAGASYDEAASGSASPSRRSASAPRRPGSSRAGAPVSWSPTSPAACWRMTPMSPDEHDPARRWPCSGSPWSARRLRLDAVRPLDLAARLAGGCWPRPRSSPRWPTRSRPTGWRSTVLVAIAGLLAVVGGGPVTTRIFAVVDRQADRPDVESLTDDRPARCCAVAPGSARWSGSRSSPASPPACPRASPSCSASRAWAATPTSATAGRSGTTERFIIGTFTSVLWAAACAGMVALVRR